MRTARLRVELEQSRKEQKDYLRNVELARILDKRTERKRKAAEAKGEIVNEEDLRPKLKRKKEGDRPSGDKKPTRKRKDVGGGGEDEARKSKLESVLGSIF